MKIVVIGGSGFLGTKLVTRLRESNHEVIAASPRTGVNTVTAEGLDNAMTRAQIVVDLSNSPSFEDAAVMSFFATSGRNLVAAERAAGVQHHIVLSIVGADRLPKSGYLRGKIAQENIIAGSGIPYTILRSTQFIEFIEPIANFFTTGGMVRVPPVLVQPIMSDDVVTALADLTLQPALNGTVDIAGPNSFRFDDLIRRVLGAKQDTREVRADGDALYFGTELTEDSLVPANSSFRRGTTGLERWVTRA